MDVLTTLEDDWPETVLEQGQGGKEASRTCAHDDDIPPGVAITETDRRRSLRLLADIDRQAGRDPHLPPSRVDRAPDEADRRDVVLSQRELFRRNAPERILSRGLVWSERDVEFPFHGPQDSRKRLLVHR